MNATLYVPERTNDARADYERLLAIVHAWHRTANELDAQVHAMRSTLLARSERIRQLEAELAKEQATRGENPGSS